MADAVTEECSSMQMVLQEEGKRDDAKEGILSMCPWY